MIRLENLSATLSFVTKITFVSKELADLMSSLEEDLSGFQYQIAAEWSVNESERVELENALFEMRSLRQKAKDQDREIRRLSHLQQTNVTLQRSNILLNQHVQDMRDALAQANHELELLSSTMSRSKAVKPQTAAASKPSESAAQNLPGGDRTLQGSLLDLRRNAGFESRREGIDRPLMQFSKMVTDPNFLGEAMNGLMDSVSDGANQLLQSSPYQQRQPGPRMRASQPRVDKTAIHPPELITPWSHRHRSRVEPRRPGSPGPPRRGPPHCRTITESGLFNCGVASNFRSEGRDSNV
eukprot:746124-Hanusia_phi.AAC.3